MAEQHHILDFGKKIQLLINSGKSALRSENDLLRALSCQKDYFARIKSGSRPLTEALFAKLVQVSDVPAGNWALNLERFGRALGLNRGEISKFANVALPGIDFQSRIKDDNQIAALFSVIEGFWESYYFSVSNIERLAISRDLVICRRRNEDNFIECEIKDGSFAYSGYCFPLASHLYFVLEKDDLQNEMIFYCLNRPDRMSPTLFGIILCVSGGVQDGKAFPSGARVAFRYLGRTQEEVLKKAPPRVRDWLAKGETLEEALQREVPQFIYPEECRDHEVSEIIRKIRNDIPSTQIPFALRMEH